MTAPVRPAADHAWSVRLAPVGPGRSRARARNLGWDVGPAASFHDSGEAPCAIELALSALGGDLLSLWHAELARAGVVVDAAELALAARLENPLRPLGVVGETGSPALAGVDGTLYVTAPGPPAAVEVAWRAALERSPLHATLTRAAPVRIALRVIA